jgi:hypothetical protein
VAPPGYIFFTVTDTPDDETTWREHLLADVHAIAQQLHHVTARVDAMHAELERFRPVLRALAPGNGTSDLQRAGMIRGLRRAARATPTDGR